MDIVTYALLNGKIKNYASNVDEWLEENVDPDTGYVLDRSLQMENAAAPADMVGDINNDVGNLRNTLNQLDADKADEASLAYIRSGATNTETQIETGTFFYLDGTLKHAIATIAQNASFTAQNCETVTAGGLNALNTQIRNVVDTSTSLQGLREGVNAFVLNSNVVIGGVTIPNKLRGYAVYNQGVVVGFGVNYNAKEFYTLGASGSNVWQYAKAW